MLFNVLIKYYQKYIYKDIYNKFFLIKFIFHFMERKIYKYVISLVRG